MEILFFNFMHYSSILCLYKFQCINQITMQDDSIFIETNKVKYI